MVFWKKGSARDIKRELKQIEKQTKRLRKIESKTNRFKEGIKKIKGLTAHARLDIRERANEECRKCWIDQKYDREIQQMTNQEIEELQKLETDLDTYSELIEESESEEEVHSLADQILDEEKKIESRDSRNSKTIEMMESNTLRDRLRHPSAKVPAGQTIDGVRFSNVVKASRELGGWLTLEGKGHQATINFPKSRPVPLSYDVGTERLSGQIREAITHSLPQHKIPNSSKLRKALENGDIKKTA